MTAPCPTFGFLVAMELAPALDATARNALEDAWVAFLENGGLYCSGGAGEERRKYVVLSEASQATEGDRMSIEAWLASRGELRAWRVGPLEDLGQAV